jgi:site-specific DNA recombinase
MDVVGYVRVSTDEQAKGGVSLASQREKVGLYCKLHDLALVEVIDDPGESAGSLDRPGLARVLAMLDEGRASGVVVAKLDRLTRSVTDLGRLLDLYFAEGPGKQLFSVADSIDTRSAAGRLVLNVLMSVSQWELETIRERTRAALAFKKSRNERVSGMIPFGRKLLDDGKTLVPAVEELAVIGIIQGLRGEGWPLRKIATELDDRGFPTRSGRPWTHTVVRDLSRRTA